MAAKKQRSSDLEEIWFPSRFWCSELISIVGLLWWPFCQWSQISMKIDIWEYFQVRNWLVMMKHASTCPNSDMGVAWRILCLHPNIIKPSYYSSSSSSSPNELVRPNSQRLMIRSLLNLTARWIPISRGALKSWNFENGYRFHGNREHMSKYFTSLISETTEGISTRLDIYIK
jgi:hypothetical protein